jgi:hypothetical protein
MTASRLDGSSFRNSPRAEGVDEKEWGNVDASFARIHVAMATVNGVVIV